MVLQLWSGCYRQHPFICLTLCDLRLRYCLGTVLYMIAGGKGRFVLDLLFLRRNAIVTFKWRQIPTAVVVSWGRSAFSDVIFCGSPLDKSGASLLPLRNWAHESWWDRTAGGFAKLFAPRQPI